MIGRILSYEEKHNTYGGEIYGLDFEPEYTKSRNYASRIAAELRFDEKCREKAKRRDARCAKSVE